MGFLAEHSAWLQSPQRLGSRLLRLSAPFTACSLHGCHVRGSLEVGQNIPNFSVEGNEVWGRATDLRFEIILLSPR